MASTTPFHSGSVRCWPSMAMMGWHTLQLRTNCSRPSSTGSDSSLGTGNGDWPRAAVPRNAQAQAAINRVEEIEEARIVVKPGSRMKGRMLPRAGAGVTRTDSHRWPPRSKSRGRSRWPRRSQCRGLPAPAVQKLIQLLERLAQSVDHAEVAVERFLRGVQFVQYEQGLAPSL